MSVLVLGAEGMLGLALCRELARRPGGGAVVAGVRGRHPRSPLPPSVRLAPAIEALDLASVEAALRNHRPHTVVNAIGIVKGRPERDDFGALMAVNGCFPHHLAGLCRRMGSRLLHISTDCVFDGLRGNYGEGDSPSARDPYGRSKALGEVTGDGAMTLRTSMIGFEGLTRRGLLAWFLNAAGPVRGYTNARFSGPSAPELARLVARIVTAPEPFGGLLHAGAAPIDKFTLLTMVRDAFCLDTEVVPDGSVRIDRSLDTRALAARYGYVAPSWPQMIAELAAEWHGTGTADFATSEHASTEHAAA